MDLSRIDARLLSRPGATKALHEKWGWMVYWVGGRQFACEFVASPDAKPPYEGRPTPTGARGSPSTWTPTFPRGSCSTSAT